MVKTRRASSTEPRSRRTQDLIGLCLFFVGAACLLWLTLPENAPAASAVSSTLRLLAGTGSYVIPVILMFVGSMFLVGFERMSFSHSTYGSLLLFITFVTWRHVAASAGLPSPGSAGGMRQDPAWAEHHVMAAGGYIGAVVGTVFLKLCGVVVTYVFLTMMGCMAVVLLVDKPFLEILRHFQQPAATGIKAASGAVAKVRGKPSRESVEDRAARLIGRRDEDGEDEESKPKRRGLLSFGRGEAEPDEDNAPTPTSALPVPVKGLTLPDKPKKRAPVSDADGPVLNIDIDTGDFKLPPLTLLKESPPPAKRSQQEITDNIKKIEETLDQFGIGANVVEIAHGPTVTRYEIQLAPGIKVSKIVSLADNLAMAMSAIDVRVEAPIPGKSAIGLEVPNAHPSLVTLRDCMDNPDFWNAPGKLTFALGKDVSGQMKYADLTKMPHLLVAGSTNSGKSVCLNVLIASLLYRATPRDIQFLMIDPKRVELSLWDGIPHLMHPVVKDVKQAAGIFRAAIKEMDRRYDLFSKLGTRNIDGYNQRVPADEKLPYMVIVVDELADLMMQAAAEIETSICRLAQLARATGIHLVIATQRPSVDVITGLIKANISSRIAFAVSSQVDSRTILDMNGADRLIGRGDMLFLPIDASKPYRIQGCYLSEEETHTLVNYLKDQESPNYTITPMEVSGMGGSGGVAGASGDDDDDELFEAAVKLVVTNGQASTSMLQRRFKIGYTRAARLVDFMQERGIVGPLDGAKPREILVTRDQVEQMFLRDIEV